MSELREYLKGRIFLNIGGDECQITNLSRGTLYGINLGADHEPDDERHPYEWHMHFKTFEGKILSGDYKWVEDQEPAKEPKQEVIVI